MSIMELSGRKYFCCSVPVRINVSVQVEFDRRP